jgi:hypothetical protein
MFPLETFLNESIFFLKSEFQGFEKLLKKTFYQNFHTGFSQLKN